VIYARSPCFYDKGLNIIGQARLDDACADKNELFSNRSKNPLLSLATVYTQVSLESKRPQK
jgi:hypothetical protein